MNVFSDDNHVAVPSMDTGRQSREDCHSMYIGGCTVPVSAVPRLQDPLQW